MDENKMQILKDIEEGIKIVSSAEEKIITLNNISSNDFLFLNNLQKRYYNNIKLIFDNLSVVTKEIDKTEINKPVEKYIDFVTKINNDIKKNKKTLSNYLSKINDISLNRSFLEISTYSFKQSIIALKLIGSSHKIDLTSEQNSKVSFINNLWGKVEKSISNIESNCKELKPELKFFSTNVEFLREYLEDHQLYFDNIENKLFKSSLNFKEWLENVAKYVKAITNSKDNVEHSFINFNNIIINLQYHDIISQKMEHIQSLLKEIRSKLTIYKSAKKSTKVEKQNTNYLTRISEISKIQIKQLLNINNEFQSATLNITQKIFDISEKITKIQKPLLQLQIIEHIKELLSNLNSNKKIFLNRKNNDLNKTDFKEIITHINRSINIIENRYLNIAIHLKHLIINITSIQENIKKDDVWNMDYSEVIDFIEQESNKIKITFFEINLLRSKIKNDCFELLNDEKKNIENIFQLNKENVEDELSPFSTLEAFLKNVNKKLISSIKLMSQFAANIDFKMDDIHYFDYYDKSIKEIITGFNKIVEILNIYDFENNDSNSKELEKLKDSYTVKSEHTIHNEIIGGNKGRDNSMEDNDEIELF